MSYWHDLSRPYYWSIKFNALFYVIDVKTYYNALLGLP